MQIGNVARCKLGEFPTPLQKLGNLSNYLGGPEIFVKRDDLNGLGLGGNKLRKLEFAMAEAQEKGATVIITTGAVQTNHGRLTLAAANRLGLDTILVLTGERPARYTGNILLDQIMGAREIHYVNEEQVEKKVETIKKELENKGEYPYFIPIGCAPLHGTLGYTTCVLEIVNQLFQRGTAANYIITPCGTSSTQAGLVLGSRLYIRGQLQIIGISVSYSKNKCKKEKIANAANQTAELLGLTTSFDAKEITVYDDYIGEGYAIPTEEMREAVKLVARKEGIILDPVYTGKAMAGLIDLIRQGKFKKGDTVVFLHTGGAPGLFAERQAEFFQ